MLTLMSLCFITIVLKCKGSCNTINDPYAKLYVSDAIKNKCQKHKHN